MNRIPDGIVTYYTNQVKSKLYRDSEGIIQHYTNALNQIGNKSWIWIFDSEGFDLKHAMKIQTRIGIAKIISGIYGNNLQELKLINSSWYIKTMLTGVMLF